MGEDAANWLDRAALLASHAPPSVRAALAAAIIGGVLAVIIRVLSGSGRAPSESALDEAALAPRRPLPPYDTPAHQAFARGALDEAYEDATIALGEADAVGDLRAAGEALLTLSDIAMARGEAGESLTQALEAERRLVAVDSPSHLIAAHARQARALSFTAQRAKGQADLEAARDRLLELGEPRMADDVDIWLAECVARG